MPQLCDIATAKGGACTNAADLVLLELWAGETVAEITPIHLCWSDARHEMIDAVQRIEKGQVTSFSVVPFSGTKWLTPCSKSAAGE